MVCFYTDTKKKKNKNKESNDKAAPQQKPEGSSELELFMASGLDLSQSADLNVSNYLCE